MKRTMLYCGALLAFGLLVGCEKKQEAPTTPPADASAAAQAATPAPAAPDKALAATTLDLSKVPVEEQYEKEVEGEVTPANFEQQLDAVEKELQAK